MKLYVVHDEAGEIKSVIQAEEEAADPGPRLVGLGADETVATVPVEGPIGKLSPLEIHENYRFDVKRGKLVRKRQSAKKAEPDRDEDE